MEEVQYYRCELCGEIVIPNPDGSCPICGAGEEYLVPCDKDGNPIEK